MAAWCQNRPLSRLDDLAVAVNSSVHDSQFGQKLFGSPQNPGLGHAWLWFAVRVRKPPRFALHVALQLSSNRASGIRASHLPGCWCACSDEFIAKLSHVRNLQSRSGGCLAGILPRSPTPQQTSQTPLRKKPPPLDLKRIKRVSIDPAVCECKFNQTFFSTLPPLFYTFSQ